MRGNRARSIYLAAVNIVYLSLSDVYFGFVLLHENIFSFNLSMLLGSERERFFLTLQRYFVCFGVLGYLATVTQGLSICY